MGKRGKSSIKPDADIKIENQVKNKKIKFDDSGEVEDCSTDSCTNKNKKGKPKNKMLENEDNSTQNDFDETAETKTEPIESTSGHNNQKNKKKSKDLPTKDGPDKNTNDESGENKQSNYKKKSKNTDLSQEDEVNDEDIDKFCDEIDEEDNKQYEDWVKLIEAKLSSNKKKTK